MERQNRTLLKAMRVAHNEGKDWREEVRHFLRAYRTTPHSTTGVSPAEMLFKRKLRTHLPSLRYSDLDGEVRDKDRGSKLRMQENADRSRRPAEILNPGDQVLVKQDKTNKLSSNFFNIPGQQ